MVSFCFNVKYDIKVEDEYKLIGYCATEITVNTLIAAKILALLLKAILFGDVKRHKTIYKKENSPEFQFSH